ncbi:MAG: VWA domain-containing protein, partial [Desulfobacteraceae bacterium]
MISQKKDFRYSCHRIIPMALAVIILMAMGGIIGCSNSSGSGDSSSGPSYHMTGYDGEPAEGSSTALLEVGNSGLNFLAQAPWFVNMTFQVSDKDGIGIPDFKVADFNVFENGTRLDTVESNINIRKRDALPPGYTYTLKTVLFIDNSANIAPETLNLMMDGAKAFLSKIDPKKQQEFAVVAFDNDGDPVLIHDFTSLTKELIPYFTAGNAFSIKRSFGTANFYGAIQFALDLWEENPSPATKTLTQGFVVVLTEGRDTTGLYNIDDAIAARDRDNKRVVSVPIGSDIPDHILAELERLGNGWYYPVPNPDLPEDDKSRKKSGDKNLVEWMTTIQERIIIFADSFYWIQYKSE